MNSIVNGIFDFIGGLFDKVPVLNKLKGYRTVLGLIGLAVVSVLQAKHIGDPALLSNIQLGLLTWTGLSLNSKGRDE